ncbi:hypothetical protein F5I97DRAFT_590661 [Phlebopus sp. FC_14]|nr:hypothetical protein F5I97DRAFT_590661 [Phlebopus sp. FC_14]
MSSTFTPSQAVDMSKEKDWPMNLGMLDWDSTNIVFTKRSLVEFLKYTGVTVDPGFTNIQKLPRFAKFGKLSANDDESSTSAKASVSSTQAAPTSAGSSRLLGEEFPDDALSTAPPRPLDTSTSSVGDSADKSASAAEEFKPSRRVRATPGGVSSIGSIFNDDVQERFVPTRKVRQRPGGEDNIEGLF